MKNTKKSLIASGISLAVSVALLAGSTFAWFTDSVTNKGNKIQAGNLKIGAYAYDLDKDGDKTFTIENVNGGNPFTFEAEPQNLKTDGTPIISETLWEPGKSSAKLLQVKNEGTLAAEIKLDFETSGELTDALWFDFVKVENGEATGKFEKRPMNTLSTFAANIELPVINNGDTLQFILVYGMYEEAGNDYMGDSFTADVTILAKQYTYEEDGFGSSDYDAGATYQWTGGLDDQGLKDNTDADTQTVSIKTPEQLASLAAAVNSDAAAYDGYTVTLESDFDLAGKEWTPIGTSAQPFSGTLDGGNHKIMNLNVESDGAQTGLFGSTNGATIQNLTIAGGSVTSTEEKTGALAGQISNTTIKGVTIDGVTVQGRQNGDSYTGGLVGYSYTGSIENCVVKNTDITGYSFTGGLVGQGYAKLSNCSVESCTVEGAFWKVGGIAGQINEGDETFTDLTVKDSVISGKGPGVGGIAGFVNYGNKTFTDCHVENCTISANATYSSSGLGGFIGEILADDAYPRVSYTFDGCTVAGLRMEGANPLENAGGFVGGKYTWGNFDGADLIFNNCAAEIVSVTELYYNSFQKRYSDVGAFVGSSDFNTTISFTGSNTAVTTGTGIATIVDSFYPAKVIAEHENVAFTK